MKLKLKLLVLLTVIVATCACLFACVSDDENTVPVVDDYVQPDYGSATVYGPWDKVQVITVDSVATQPIIDEINRMTVYGSRGGAYIGSLYSENKKLEILVGIDDIDGSRPILATARRLLERMDRESIFDARYLVYADGGQIAIVFDENEYTNLQPIDYAIEAFVEQCLAGKEYFAAPQGVVMSGTVDLIEVQEEIDTELVSKKWAELENILGRDIAISLRKIYSMYDDKMVGWAANLYDPGVGGFYTCRSGRNGEEFGPDVECTVQILRFIGSSGMLDTLEGGIAANLPMKMQQQLIYFGKSLQDKDNGYFYHPQWGKEETDNRLSRRGRDLGWGTSLLDMFGARPAYNAPNGKAGDGITADEYWDSLVESGEALGPKPYPCTQSPTEESIASGSTKMTSSLGVGSESAVAILVATTKAEDSTTAYLKTHTAFINYLLTTVGKQMDSNPYSGGNNLNATYAQILSYSTANGEYTYTAGDEASCIDQALALSQFKVNTDDDSTNDMTLADIYEFFDGMTMCDMLISFLNEKINPEIGVWGQKSASNPKGTEFLFTNGFFKTITIYNSWKIAYPAEYIDDAARALLDGLLGDQPSTGNVCEVYNIWSAIGSLKSNLKYLDDSIVATDEFGNTIYDDAGDPVQLKTYIKDQVDDILYTNASDALLNTYTKIYAYKMPDGGFDHAVKRSAGGYTTQQGLPTGYAMAGQSNIDATCIATTGLVGTIYTAFGISSANKVPIFTESDWMRMVEIFVNLDPVIKYSTEEKVKLDPVITFENDYSAGLKIVTNSQFSELNTWDVVKVDGDEKLFINKDGKDTSGKTYNGGVSMSLKVTESEKNAKYLVCEFDVRFENVVAFDSQITIDSTGGTGKKSSPFIFGLPKNMYNKDVHVIIVYQITETDENGHPKAFEALYQYNDGKASVTTEVQKQATNITGGSMKLPTVDSVTQIVIALNNSFLGDAYFDNFRLAKTSELPEGINRPDVTPDEPQPDVPSGPVEPVIGFDNDYSASLNIKTNAEYAEENTWTVVTTDGNKELKISKNAVDNVTGKYLAGVVLSLKVTDREENAKYMVCEFDVRYENISSFASQITINHKNDTTQYTNKQNSPFLFTLPNKRNEKLHVVIVYEVTETDAGGNPTAFKATRYLNGLVAEETTTYHKDATKLISGETKLPRIDQITSIDIALNNGFKGDAYFDNMSLKLLATLPDISNPEPPHEHKFVDGKCECGASDPSYKPETEPTVSFDKDYSSVIKVETNDYFAESNTWKVVEVEGDNKLFINKTEKDTRPNSYLSGVSIYLQVTEQEENAKYMVCEFDVRFENINGFDSQIIINHGTYKGKVNSPFLFNLPKDKIGVERHIAIIYEVTAVDGEGKPTAMKATLMVDGIVTLEYTEVYKTGTNILNGSTPIPAADDVNTIIISLNNSFLGEAYYDNMSLKLLKELPDFNANDEPEGEKDPVITFDKDYTGSIVITNNPTYAPLNSWKVVDVDGDKKLFIDKCDSDTSGKTYNGGVATRLSVTYREEDARYMVFETDLYMLNVKAMSSQIVLHHSNKSHKQNSPFFFSLPSGYKSGELLHIVITYEVTATDADGVPTEYKAMYIINGKLVEETTTIYKDATNILNGTTALPRIDQIDCISFDLNNSCIAEAYFDNMSLKLLKELPDLIETHTHEFVEGKCECGETDPNYVAPHEHNFVNGKCECGESDPNYVAPHEHNFVNGKCECGESDPNYVPENSGGSGSRPNFDDNGWSKP